MALTAEIKLKVQFYEGDPMGIVWHGNYFRFFEQVRVVLMEQIGYSYREMIESGYIWPIIDVRVKYIKSIEYNTTIAVQATLTEYENRLRIDYEIRDAGTGERMTKGHTVQVAVSMATGEMSFVSPPALLDRLSRQ